MRRIKLQTLLLILLSNCFFHKAIGQIEFGINTFSKSNIYTINFSSNLKNNINLSHTVGTNLRAKYLFKDGDKIVLTYNYSLLSFHLNTKGTRNEWSYNSPTKGEKFIAPIHEIKIGWEKSIIKYNDKNEFTIIMGFGTSFSNGFSNLNQGQIFVNDTRSDKIKLAQTNYIKNYNTNFNLTLSSTINYYYKVIPNLSLCIFFNYSGGFIEQYDVITTYWFTSDFPKTEDAIIKSRGNYFSSGLGMSYCINRSSKKLQNNHI